MDNSNLAYRENVCLIITNAKGQIFIGKRNQGGCGWQLPQGGVEEEGTLADNAIREGAEELGVEEENLKIIRQLEGRHEYDFSNPPEYAKGVFRGQSQTFWLLEYVGQDSEIQLDLHDAEFSDWRWCDWDNLLQSTEELRHGGYKKFLPQLEVILNG